MLAPKLLDLRERCLELSDAAHERVDPFVLVVALGFERVHPPAPRLGLFRRLGALALQLLEPLRKLRALRPELRCTPPLCLYHVVDARMLDLHRCEPLGQLGALLLELHHALCEARAFRLDALHLVARLVPLVA